MRVLLVCTGNTCRSAMAEAMLGRLLAAGGPGPAEGAGPAGGVGPAWEAASAGTSALPGAPAAPAAVQALSEAGLDLSGHRARQLTPEMIQSSDLILTMTREQKRAVVAMAPGAGGRTFTLRESVLAGRRRDAREQLEAEAGQEGLDVPDPFGRPLEEYRACARALEEDLRALSRRLAEGWRPS